MLVRYTDTLPPHIPLAQRPVPSGEPVLALTTPQGAITIIVDSQYEWEPAPGMAIQTLEVLVAVVEGAPVGEITISHTPSPTQTQTWSVCGITAALPSRGVGTALYLAAAARAATHHPGARLLSWGSRTSAAHRTWQRLVAAGLSVEMGGDPRDPSYALTGVGAQAQELFDRCALTSPPSRVALPAPSRQASPPQRDARRARRR